MFTINSYLITKMGWYTYSQHRGIGLTISTKIVSNLFENDPLVRFFIIDSDVKLCYVIKELSEKEKQKSKNLYKFIVCYYDYDKPKFEVTEFNSNEEVFKLIIEHNACNDDYKRHFKLNKILNK